MIDIEDMMSLEDMQEIIELSMNDFDDMEIFCVCTGTCVTLRCVHG